jgi:CheY-like chemotaxis protein
MSTLLIADDQIPDSNLRSEQEIRDKYTKQYGDAEFAAGFVFMHDVIKMLKEDGYEVDCANTPCKMTELVEKKQYDVIVLDLGWFTAENLSDEDKMLLGFPMAKKSVKVLPRP